MDDMDSMDDMDGGRTAMPSIAGRRPLHPGWFRWRGGRWPENVWRIVTDSPNDWPI